MKITIKGVEKEIAFNEYTRAIDKGFKNILYKNFNIGINEEVSDAKINPMTIEEANDYLVKSLANITDEELNDITLADYNILLDECKKLQNPPKK